MSPAEELWSTVQSATTLRNAHDALGKVRPSLEATQVQWLDFHQRSAETYRRVAESDRGRRKESLFLAELHKEKAEKVAHGLASGATVRAGSRRVAVLPGRPHEIRLRDDMFAKAMRLAGFQSDYAVAKAMGLHRSTVKRARAGELRPGARFISGALTALAPFDFEDLFEVETQE
ncbi:AMED_5909 family protein [Actinosynnema sp. CA-299493]